LTRRTFEIYRPDGYASAKAIESLDGKIANAALRSDIDNLLAVRPSDYDIDAAGMLIKENFFK
jgi:hypothetical protein